jgi:hypothetical protein
VIRPAIRIFNTPDMPFVHVHKVCVSEFTDSLLRIVKTPTLAFADDLKLIVCTSAFTHQDVQNDIIAHPHVLCILLESISPIQL